MTASKFSNALGNVDDRYVDEAAAYAGKKKKNIWVRWGAVAACLLLLLVGVIVGGIHHPQDDGLSSYFVITAHAASGESTELNVGESYFNSGGVQESIFGVDVPVFDFSVRPSNWEGREAVWSKFDIAVSYNGNLVGGKDEHILVAYLIPTPNSDAVSGYSVMGWFTEPTDILISITDKESGELVEAITVHVSYMADAREYQIKVTEINTLFAAQKKAVDANEVLMAYFFDQGWVQEYPAYFGGCYMENNMLHIRLVAPSEEDMRKLSTLLADYKAVVVFEYGDISYADLQAYADETANGFIELGYGITYWYVDSTTGNIVIGVLEKDLEAVAARIADSEAESGSPKIVVEKGAYASAE